MEIATSRYQDCARRGSPWSILLRAMRSAAIMLFTAGSTICSTGITRTRMAFSSRASVCTRASRQTCDGRAGRPIHDFAAEQCQLAHEVLELIGRDGRRVAVPDGDVRALADLDRAGFFLQEQLMRGP